MLKLYLGKAHVICWIVIGSLVQAQGFSTTVVKEGEDAIIDCGLQTKVEEGYLRWETMNNGSLVDLAYDIRDGHSSCDDRIIKCTLYANGSIQLESVSKEDGARYYRCLRGDDKGYDYYSDHRLLVLSKESPTISQSPPSAIAFKASRKGIVHSYGEPVCEDDVDGNLPVVCYPLSGILVDREYVTIQCNCTDSDGLMDNVTFPVTSLTHWVHPDWKTATISLSVILILIILVLILICCYLYMKAYHPENLAVLKGSKRRKEDDKMAADPEELNLIESGTKDKQISDLKDKIAALEGTLNNSNTELQEREREVSHLTEQLEQKKKQETEMKNKLEEQNQKINTIQTEITERKEEVSHLKDQLEQKQRQETEMKNKLEEQNEKINNIQTKLTAREAEVSDLKNQLVKKETEMKNKLEEQNEQISKIEKELAVKEAENNGLEERLKDNQQLISSLEKILYNPAFFQQQRETASKQDGKKYQEDDNNSEFDKNSSPSEKETKEEGTPRKGKKRDPERRLTQMGFPNMPPQETPGKNNQNDQDVETDIDDSPTEENKDLDKDETDFSKSKRCSNASGTKLRAFKDYFIEDVSKCKGFNLGFKCDGTDMRIELRINDDTDGVICHYEFRNGWIIPSFREKPEKAIGVTNETSYELNLGDDMKVLSLCQGKSAQRNNCLHKFEKYDFLQLRLLCIYTSDTSSVSILSHPGLIEL